MINFISQNTTIEIGSKVVCKVQKVLTHQAVVEILGVGDVLMAEEPKTFGIVKKEDMQEKGIETLVTHDCYRPGDVIVAEVASLGDARQYFLKTGKREHGVIKAKSKDGNSMRIKNWTVRSYLRSSQSFNLNKTQGNGGPFNFTV